MSFYQKIAHDFGGKPGGSNDSSLSYAKDKKLILYICQKNSRRFLSFKGFIENFKLAVKYSFEEQEAFTLEGKQKFLNKTNVEYHFTLNVPSNSEKEGEINLAKFQELSRYLLPVLGETKAELISSDNLLFVSFSNLIQSGQFIKDSSLIEESGKVSYNKIRKFGAPCYLSKINFKPAMEMGFYDQGSNLIPRAYSVDFQLHVAPQKLDSGFYLLRSFTKQGNYSKGSKKDSKFWPFGVDDKGMEY